jgi:hypothetical protein
MFRKRVFFTFELTIYHMFVVTAQECVLTV